MLCTAYWHVLIVMLLCYLWSLLSSIRGLCALRSQKDEGIGTKWKKFRLVQAALEANDPIMVGLYVTVEEVKLPRIKLSCGSEVPVAIVQGFVVSEQMGRILMQGHGVAEAVLHKCFAADPPSADSTEVDTGPETDNQTVDIATRFQRWKEACLEQGHAELLLTADTIMMWQLLISCGQAPSATARFAS
mmetsp:Transcript_90585/g.242622  ORF Transcript_90585/g.242622 Transcript_90585/m.242622 type:complete len:189 (-) Transcript_90585:977-1543(-)